MIPPDFEAYYDSGKKCFWIRDDLGAWVEVYTEGLRLKLRCLGANSSTRGGKGVSEIDRYVANLYTSKNVIYAGPLAGHRSGLLEQYGNRILVINSPKIIQPVKGCWKDFGDVLKGMLFHDAYDQRDYFHGWILCARKSLISEDFKPGQCLGVAGPVDGGKSFLQNRITDLLGGRAAKPYQYMANDTTFNRELFGAEHQMIEDVISSTDLRARRAFGSRIKEFTVNEVQSCHGKHREGINMKPFWRVSLTVNDTPEDLLVLPPMIDSVADKFILLKAAKFDFPEETDVFKNLIDEQLKHYLYWLHHEWEMPKHLFSRRFGVKSWHHPELLEYINELSPEQEFLSLIDTHVFVHGRREWFGTPEELREMLRFSAEKQSESVLKWPPACKTYLKRLAGRLPKRFMAKRTSVKRGYLILSPDHDGVLPNDSSMTNDDNNVSLLSVIDSMV